MKKWNILGVFLLSSCSSPAGQLFCAIDTGGGGTIVAGVIDAAATAKAGPLGGPVAVLATNATTAVVQADCAAAAANVGAKAGVPVSPPTGTVPNIAIKN